jgi:hypothetical protein
MSTAPAGKIAATKAAKALLAERIALVEKLGDALDAHTKAVQAVATAQQHADDTAAAARVAFDAAKTGGWTAPELNSSGLTPPPAPRARRSKDTTDTGKSSKVQEEQPSTASGDPGAAA